jgi:S1-C subfamily serine protease
VIIHDLQQIMNNHRAGDSVKITYMRGRKKMEATVLLGEARERV